MCDTFLISKGKNRYFLKNSDRSPNEPNLIVRIPHLIHKEDSLKCTYISIEQVKETYSCLLVKPSWLWGAEMGINEFNVAIGNEAVFTKKKNKKPSLIGMDYLRLALERARSAKEAIDVITSLLVKYGQGGNCGYDHKFYYDNSYLIADKKETYVLETCGKDYAYKKIDGSYNISNRLSLDTNYDFATKNYKKGFKKENSDFFFTFFSKSKDRECNGKKLISEASDDILSMIDVLSYTRKEDTLFKGDVGSVCMVKTPLGDHSTGSMIVNLSLDNPTIWLSGGSLPLLSVYKPFYLNSKNELLDSDDNYKLDYYVKRTIVDRLVASKHIDYSKFKDIRNQLNKEFVLKESELRNNNVSLEKYEDFSNEAFIKEKAHIDDFDLLVNKVKSKEIKLNSLWDKLTNRLSKNPFSDDLKLRLRH